MLLSLPCVTAFFLGDDELKRVDSAGDHIVIGLICRYALHLLSRPCENFAERVFMSADPTVYLIADADYDGQNAELKSDSR